MGPHRARRATAIITLLLLLGALLPIAPAAAQTPPANDEIETARVIHAPPFGEDLDAQAATAAADDPPCGGGRPSVWYAYTADRDGELYASVYGAGEPAMSIYEGVPGDLAELACNRYWEEVPVQVRAGRTYYLLVTLDTAQQEAGDLWVGVTARPEMSLTLDAVAHHTRDGRAVLTGTVTCSWPVEPVHLVGYVRQVALGRLFIVAHFQQQLGSCDGTVPWTVTTEHTAANGLLRGGQAAVHISAWGCDYITCSAETSETRRLRAMREPRP